jgi:hypothetical protein
VLEMDIHDHDSLSDELRVAGNIPDCDIYINHDVQQATSGYPKSCHCCNAPSKQVLHQNRLA